MLEFKSPTNKIQKIKLDSSIELISWAKSNAVTDSKVGLEVITKFVGNNSEVTIDLSDKTGKKFNSVKGKIFGNKFFSDIFIPENAKEEFYAEAKLTKHGLSLKSKPLYLVPPVIIKNLKWDKSDVHRGDLLKISAEILGAPDGAEAIIGIWEQSSKNSNELLTEIPVIIKAGKAECEWEFQYPGDVKEIPVKDETPEGYYHPQFFFQITVANSKAESEPIKFYDFLDFQLLDALKEPVANIDYILHLPDGTQRTGKLDESGKTHEEDLPPGRIKIEIQTTENLISK